MTALLLQYPQACQLTSHPRLRRITTPPYAFAIFYEAADDEIIIVGLRHGARDPLDSPTL